MICKICDRDFKNFAALLSHEKHKHSEPKLFVCSRCGKNIVSTNNSAIITHEQNCSGEGTKLDIYKNSINHICPKCNTYIKTNIKRHIDFCDGRATKKSRIVYSGNRGGWNRGLTKQTNLVIKEAGIKISNKMIGIPGKKHSDETKKQISLSRKKYLLENPDKVPYLLNHSSKGPSYPETYWNRVIENEKINLKYHLQVSIYELDFYNEDLKIDFEVDGEQHFSTVEAISRDIERTKYLESLGWKVIRLRWKEWCKFSDIQKKEFISDLKIQTDC